MSVTEDSLMVAGEPRRPGRPKATDPQERLSTRIPTRHYDRLVKAAQRRDQTVSSLVRQILLAQKFLR